MNQNLSSSQPTLSYRQHRRQFFWQILLPVLIFALLALAAAGFLAWGGAADTRHLADVALIWLVLPLLLIALLLAALLVTLVYLLARLLKVAPLYTARGQSLLFRITNTLNSLADKAVIPVIKINEFLAALQYLMRK